MSQYGDNGLPNEASGGRSQSAGGRSSIVRSFHLNAYHLNSLLIDINMLNSSTNLSPSSDALTKFIGVAFEIATLAADMLHSIPKRAVEPHVRRLRSPTPTT